MDNKHIVYITFPFINKQENRALEKIEVMKNMYRDVDLLFDLPLEDSSKEESFLNDIPLPLKLQQLKEIFNSIIEQALVQHEKLVFKLEEISDVIDSFANQTDSSISYLDSFLKIERILFEINEIQNIIDDKYGEINYLFYSYEN